MRVNRIPRIIAVMVLAGGLALTGCSKDTEKNEEEPVGPLDKYLQALWGNEEFDEEKYKKEEAERQEFIAKCMSEQGWEYIPVPYQDGGVVIGDDGDGDEGPAYGTLEFAQKYGYGAVNWPGQDETEEPEAPMPEEEYVDPNQDYVMSLTEKEQSAYYEALYGKWDEFQELDPDGNPIEPSYDPSQMGCYGKSEAEINGDQVWNDPDYEELMNSMSEDLYPTSENNDEMRTLESEWATCMTGKGYAFSTRQEAQQYIWDKVSAPYDNHDWEAQPDGPDEAAVNAAREAVQEEEIKQAVDDFTCADDIKYDDKMQEIYFANQQKFVDEHKTQLEALVAKYGKN